MMLATSSKRRDTLAISKSRELQIPAIENLKALFERLREAVLIVQLF
jgi:hypothetical protein